jgi:hypothetical protein
VRAETALCKVLDRLGPGGGRASITLAEFVDEYLEMHQAQPVTIAKLRWLLSKATAVLGEKPLADLSPRDVYGWRFSVPEGHSFEATQALRQVLNRAVAWGLLDYNPAKRGVPNPARRAKEKRPFETWREGRSRGRATRAGVRADGDLRGRDRTQAIGAVRTRAARRRPATWNHPCPPRVRQWPAQAYEDAAKSLFR